MRSRGGRERLAGLLDGALSIEEMLRKRLLVAGVGLCSHALYFFLWTAVFPQPFEAPLLRAVLAALFLPFLLPQHWLLRREPLWRAYWQVTFMLNLPFFFTYMALLNNSWVWVLGLLGALLMMFLLAAGELAAIWIVIGVGLAVACALPFGVDLKSSLVMQAWPVLAFSLLAALVLSRSQQKQSRRKTEALMSYAGYIAHELRTPLVSIAARASLSQSSADETGRELRQHLQELSREVQRSFALIDILLTNMDPGRHIPPGSDRDGGEGAALISEVLRDALLRYPFRDAKERAAVEVRVLEDCLILGSPLLLQHVVMNLVRNAFQHGAGGRPVSLAISVRRQSRACEVSVCDDGPGMPVDALSRPGLGLLFCRSVARSIGGDLTVVSPVKSGCTLRLRLPSVDGRRDASPGRGPWW